MKFAHMSDIHLGSWSAHPELAEKASEAFDMAADICIKEKIDFVIIAGDLFDTSMPSMDVLRRAIVTIKRIHDAGLRIYVVPGSHDFSPTGKTAISLLEAAGFLKNVAAVDENGFLKFVVDGSVAVSGMLGRKGSLEHDYYNRIQVKFPESSYKIFVMHSAIQEYKPAHLSQMPALPLSSLPSGFDYYANGHVHKHFIGECNDMPLIFPGPLFPTEFTEMEEYDGGFYIVDTNGQRTWRSVKLFGCEIIGINGDGKDPAQIEDEIILKIKNIDITDKALLIKAKGVMRSGKISEINFKKINDIALEKNAFTVKKNFNGLSTMEYDEIRVDTSLSVDAIEQKIIEEHCHQNKIDGYDMKSVSESLINILKDEKFEGETIANHEKRVKENFMRTVML